MPDIVFNERELAVISESEKRASQHVRAVESSITSLNRMLGAVVIVLFVALLTMVVGIAGIIGAAYQTYTTSYNEYSATVQSLNNALQSRKEKNTADQIQKIEEDIGNLWSSKYPIRK